MVAIAQQYDNLIFQRLSGNEGLSNPKLFDIFKDSYGLVWLSTANGLTTFDGISTRVYRNDPQDSHSLVSNYITKIIEDKDFNLWIGTQKGFSMYHRQTNRFINFSSLKSNVPIPKNFYTYPFYIDSIHRLWAYVAGEIMVINTGLKTATSIGKFGNGKVFVDKPFYQSLDTFYTNNLFGFNKIYYDKSKKKFVQKSYLNGKEGSPKLTINNLLIDQDNLWLSTNKGVVIFNTTTEKYLFKPITNNGNDVVVQHISRSPFNDQVMMISTADAGLWIMGKGEDSKPLHIHKDALDDHSIMDDGIEKSLLDKDGNFFLLHPDKGMSFTNIFRGLFYKHLSVPLLERQTIDHNITHILPCNNNVLSLITKNDGLLLYDVNSKKILKHLLKGLRISWQLKVPDGILLFSQGQGFYLLGNDLIMLNKLAHDNPNIINYTHNDIISVNGQILLCTDVGLWKLVINKNGIKTTKFTSIDKQVEWNHFQKIIPIDDTSILLQAFYTNIYLVKLSSEDTTVIKEIDRTPYFTTSYIRKGNNIILATSDGLFAYDISRGKLNPYALSQEYTQGCYPYEGDRNLFWVPTTNGLLLYNDTQRTYIRYERKDGLTHNTCNANAFATMNGKHYIGTIAGVTSLDIAFHQQHQIAVRPIITRFLVDDTVDNAIPNPLIINDIRLPYDKNTISIGISPLTFASATEATLKYRLHPLEKNFNSVKGSHLIRYPMLPSGAYTFQVYDESMQYLRSIEIEVDKPFWLQWWFLLSVVALTILGVYYIIRWRVASAKRRQMSRLGLMIQSQEEERQRIANDLHDDFGARLSTLKMFLQLLPRQDKDKAQETTTTASRMLDDTITDLRNILHNLSPKTLQENGLTAAIKEMAHNVRRLTAISVHLDLHSHKMTFSSTIDHSVFRILQELINNTIKHSKAQNIHISIVDYDDYATLLYEDDGVGYEIEKTQKGFGSNNLFIHAKLINATLLIDSAPGKGLAATLNIPHHSHKKNNKY